MTSRAHIFEQIVPSPMRGQWGKTVEGHLSQHSLDGTGSRLFLVNEFDFCSGYFQARTDDLGDVNQSLRRESAEACST